MESILVAPSTSDWRVRGSFIQQFEALGPQDAYTRQQPIDLGTLDGSATLRDRLSLSNLTDDVHFRLDQASNLSLALTDVTAPLRFYLFRSSQESSPIAQSQGSASGQASYAPVLSLESSLTPMSLALTPGDYVLRLVRTSASTPYTLNLLAAANPAQLVSRYTYTYWINGLDQGGDFYTGYGYAPQGTYSLGLYDLPAINPVVGQPGSPGQTLRTAAGRYQIHRVDTVAANSNQLNRVYTTDYSAQPPSLQGAPIYGTQGLGSELLYSNLALQA